MKNIKKILVTGAGSLLGQGILRLLQISDFQKIIYTADPDPRSTGHWLGDYALTIPKVSKSNYIETIKKIVIKYNINAILIGTDVELIVFSKLKNQFLEKYNCRVIVSNEETIRIANDKYLTAIFLKKNKFPFPYSVMANDKAKMEDIAKKLGFPLIAKPIDGARSLGIIKINNHSELMSLYSLDSKMVIQHLLPETEGEFTSGCIVIKGKCKVIITLKRDLRDGNTNRTYRSKKTSKYDKYIIKIAEKLNADGPVNFQFRVFNDKPIIFEINGRYSGTTPIRYIYGFNEVEAILKYYLFNQEIIKPTLRNGMVMRALSDVFVNEDDISKFNSDLYLSNPQAEFFGFSLK